MAHKWLHETCGSCVYRVQEHCLRRSPRVTLMPGQPTGHIMKPQVANQVTIQKIAVHPPVTEANPACGEWSEIPPATQ